MIPFWMIDTSNLPPLEGGGLSLRLALPRFNFLYFRALLFHIYETISLILLSWIFPFSCNISMDHIENSKISSHAAWASSDWKPLTEFWIDWIRIQCMLGSLYLLISIYLKINRGLLFSQALQLRRPTFPKVIFHLWFLTHAPLT